MEKLKLKDIDFKDDREKRINEILKDDEVVAFLVRNKIDINEVNILSPFENYAQSNIRCEACTNIDNCTQKLKGKRLALEYDEVVTENLVDCDFSKELNKRDKFLNNFVYNDIPLNMRYITLSSMKEDFNTKVLNNTLKLYVTLNKIVDKSETRGVYIYGKFGIGKTHMASAFVNELAQKGERVAFVKANDFINRMRKLIITDDEEYENILFDIKRVPYLVLDDMGSETISAYSRDDLLFNILDYRMENKLLTVFTGNMSIDDLEKNLVNINTNIEKLKAQRLMERIRCLARSIAIDGENKRLQ